MKFISIIGYDRSGTTFLGSYVSLFGEKIFYAGEIDKGIQKIKEGRNEKCSCGETYFECPVWGKILPDVDVDNVDFNFIFKRIKEITGAEVIVDSSKSLSYIKKFKKIFGEDHYTVHVKRNPKGVINSRMKNRRRRVEAGTHPKPYIANKYNLMMMVDCVAWSYENVWMENFKNKKNNLNLTYDTMDKELPEKLIKFYQEIGISVGDNQIENHILWGAKTRLNFNKEIKINHKWNQSLNGFQKNTVDAITLPVRSLCKYKFS